MKMSFCLYLMLGIAGASAYGSIVLPSLLQNMPAEKEKETADLSSNDKSRHFNGSGRSIHRGAQNAPGAEKLLSNSTERLIQAAKYGRLYDVRLLIQNGVNLEGKDEHNVTALWWAVYDSHFDVVRALAEMGADVNIKDSRFGWTPLHCAVMHGHLDVSAYLVARGADVNSKANDCMTPLLFAVYYGLSDIAKTLIASGGNVNAKTKKGETMLIFAANSGRLDILKIAVSAGADVNAQDDVGLAALHLAAYKGRLDIVKILVERGANVNLPINNGMTPLNFARMARHSHIAKYLISKGAHMPVDRLFVTALHPPEHGSLDEISALIQEGTDVNERKIPQGFAVFLQMNPENQDVKKELNLPLSLR